MKYLTFLLMLLCTNSLMAADVVVAISPYQSTDRINDQLKWLNEGFAKLDGGTEIQILDADTAHEVTRFVLPHKASHRHPKALKKRFKRNYAMMMHHAQKANLSGNLRASGHVPLLFNHLADYQSKTRHLWLLVSPIYDRAGEQDYSMAGFKVPSHGAIAAKYPDLPYGTQKRNGSLSNMSVHWWTPPSSPNPAYVLAVRESWQLYLNEFGAKLVTMSADPQLVMRRATINVAPLPLREKLNREDKVYMVQMRDVTPEDSLFTAPVSSAPLQVDDANTLSIGIQWVAPVDLDLHVRPAADAERIYYSNQNTDFGKHYKDILSGSADANTQYETIDIKRPVDLRGVEIAVNYYRGKAPSVGVSGALRLSIQGQVYAIPFALKAKDGNKGADVAAALSSGQSTDHTLILRMDDIRNVRNAS